MPELLKQPLVWAVAGVTLLIGAILVATTIGSDDQVVVGDPFVSTSTTTDVIDDLLTATGGDVDDLAEPRVLTGTVVDGTTDADDERPGTQVGAALVADEFDQCLWLVNIPGEKPAKLFIAAWPTDTEITWEPARVTVGGTTRVEEGDRVIADATIFDSVDQLTSDEFDRLMGMESCEHQGVVVFDDGADTLVVG